MKKIMNFFKENKFISIGFVLAIIIIILYVLTIDVQEWFDGGAILFDLINQIAIGFIISFIFFLTQVYLPNLKKKVTINKHMSRSIKRITEKMEDSFNVLNTKYGNSSLEPYSKENLKLFLNLNPEENTTYLNILENRKYTCAEYLRENIFFVNTGIVTMFKYYIMEMPPELIDLLEKIRETKYHTVLSVLLCQSKQTFSQNNDLFFNEYFNLMLQLKEFLKHMNENNI